MISTVAWFVCLTIARVMPSVDIVIDQFVALSATSRALAYFKVHPLNLDALDEPC